MAKEINPATSNPNASAGASQHEAMINENQPAENLGPGIGEQQGAGRRGEVMARVFACNGCGRTYPPPRRRGRCPACEKEADDGSSEARRQPAASAFGTSS
jgi:rubrerythrin